MSGYQPSIAQNWLVPQLIPTPQSDPVRIDSSNRLIRTNNVLVSPLCANTISIGSTFVTPGDGTLVSIDNIPFPSPLANCTISRSSATSGSVELTSGSVLVIAPTAGSTSTVSTYNALRGRTQLSSAASYTGTIAAVAAQLYVGANVTSAQSLIAFDGSNFLFGVLAACTNCYGVSGIGMNVLGGAYLNGSTITSLKGSRFRGLTLTGSGYNTITSGTITLCYGLSVAAFTSLGTLSTNFTIGTAAAINIEAQPAHASTTHNVGLLINNISGGTNNYGIWFGANNASGAAGIVFGASGDTMLYRKTTNQLLTPGDWSARHYFCSSTPTIAAGAGAGTAPTISITGTDHGFSVTLTQGNPTATGTVFTVTFGATWTTLAPSFACSPGNANAAALSGTSLPYISAVSTTVLTFTSGSVALVAGTQYIWRFAGMR